ncbi:aldo/keto reductase [Leptothoe sp. PORK10 BA2]|uniref:aldo/keto reductase n=1 Tax=Leptothoe sp. PORK10 BA2 TaxID=3110254 RepID=UPI002B1E9EE5|nr:aldo/keto reductase [Leptothoe sp. PORK10 BA2]MEA5465563.1 aldo/keto reductase [Leptothoe sp. PORK10 BA2]
MTESSQAPSPSLDRQTVTLTPNGPEISALGVGTWSWGDSLFWQYGQDYGAGDVQQAFEASLGAGITFFDTAEIYGLGKSEQLLGQFIQGTDRPVTVATKYFPLPWRFNAQSVADALTASLKRLQLPTVALYQVHWPFDFLMGQKVLMNALADEVNQGRIQSIGVSNYSASQMHKAHGYLAERGIPLAVNQVQYSLLHRKIESNGVLTAAQDLGITILAYSPLAQGLVTGKYTVDAGQPPTGARRIDPRFSSDNLRKIEPVITVLREMGQRHGKTPAQVALNWLIGQGNVVPIPGAKTASQAQQNAGALGWTLTPEEQGKIGQVTLAWL